MYGDTGHTAGTLGQCQYTVRSAVLWPLVRSPFNIHTIKVYAPGKHVIFVYTWNYTRRNEGDHAHHTTVNRGTRAVSPENGGALDRHTAGILGQYQHILKAPQCSCRPKRNRRFALSGGVQSRNQMSGAKLLRWKHHTCIPHGWSELLRVVFTLLF